MRLSGWRNYTRRQTSELNDCKYLLQGSVHQDKEKKKQKKKKQRCRWRRRWGVVDVEAWAEVPTAMAWRMGVSFDPFGSFDTFDRVQVRITGRQERKSHLPNAISAARPQERRGRHGLRKWFRISNQPVCKVCNLLKPASKRAADRPRLRALVVCPSIPWLRDLAKVRCACGEGTRQVQPRMAWHVLISVVDPSDSDLGRAAKLSSIRP